MIALCSLAAAGCAVERTTPTEAPAAPAATVTPGPAQVPAVFPLPTDATGPAPSAAASIQAPDTTKPAPLAPKAVPTSQAVGAPTGSSEKPGAVTAAPNSLPPPAASQTAADTLDLTSLGARLRATKAIGVLTKLSVKNQADDLLEEFRDYYKRRSTATLPDLRRSYDMLVVKLLSLLQDGDPPLATDINRSRAAIWDILSDQRRFTDSNLMAGASL